MLSSSLCVSSDDLTVQNVSVNFVMACFYRQIGYNVTHNTLAIDQEASALIESYFPVPRQFSQVVSAGLDSALP